MNRPNPTIALLLWLTAAYAASAIGIFGANRGFETLYPSLVKPSWTPPMAVFPVVWTILYALIGLAAWRVSQTESPHRGALALWWLQLLLNAAWPWLFFGLAKLGPALIEIVVLWFAILATLLAFARKDRTAAWLLFPYLAWVGFAVILNLAMWRGNR